MPCLRVKIYRKRVTRSHLCSRKSTLAVAAARGAWRGKGHSGISESHAGTQWHAMGLWRESESVRVRVTRRVFLEEVGLELALEGFRGRGREVWQAGDWHEQRQGGQDG